MQKTNDKTDNIIAVVLALIVYIPATSTGNLIRLGVVIVAFVMKHMNESPEPEIRKIGLYMLLSPMISVFFVFIIEGFGLNWEIILHEIQRMVFCSLLLMTVVKMQISFRMIYCISILVLIPNFIIQLLQQAQVESVFTFIRNHYESNVSSEEWTHLDLAREEGEGFRAGSIFINPNVYMAIPLMALVVFLHQDRERSSIWNYGLIGCSAYSCFLTGSRTATVVLAIIMLWYIIKYARTLSRVFLIIAIFYVGYTYGSYLLTTRAAKIFEADSFEVKLNSFKWFFASTSQTFIYWITGAIGSRIASYYFDGEIGYIYGWYGIFGVYWYIQYYKYIWKNNANLSFYTKPIFVVHLFVAVTASVLLCMPTYSYVSVIAFSRFYYRNRET